MFSGQKPAGSAAAQAPFLAGDSPRLFGFASWRQLDQPRDLERILDAPQYAAWSAFRDSEDTRYVGLAMPRFLTRLPYGAGNAVEGFAFAEELGGDPTERLPWANSAFAFAANVARSFQETGWFASIRGAESGGEVEGAVCYPYRALQGGMTCLGPAEVAIADRRERELAAMGLNALCNFLNSDHAAFFAAVSLQRPTRYTDERATASALLAAQLPPLLCTCRFAHHLRCIIREAFVGVPIERRDLERWLNDWIAAYVAPCRTVPNSAESIATYPLQAAEVRVEEVAGAPGRYELRLSLQPRLALEGCAASVYLASRTI